MLLTVCARCTVHGARCTVYGARCTVYALLHTNTVCITLKTLKTLLIETCDRQTDRRKEFRRHPDENLRTPRGPKDHILPTTELQNTWSLCHRRPIAALNADNMLIP